MQLVTDMRKVAWALAAVWVAAAAAADDGTAWLSWDNGTASNYTYNAYNQWLGNDFSVATLSGYRYVTKMRLYYVADWPNAPWEGGRIGLFRFSGGEPGTMFWGPAFVKPTGAGWNEFTVGRSLGTMTAFAAAWEQFYGGTNFDCVAYDTGPNQGHTWVQSGGSWNLVSANRNLMLRVEVTDEYTAATPASLGRVKALYR